ncbi:tetratricopeptide repeat-containing sensor histidine kinase [Flavobacterium sp. 3HN19-14]|uniref:tetratricopeptide repeat-containing sensor histidine kinase n=1 Tax=Flavobacterium sp. 3HN19-14 TaxID=3448133 RepID=UPI003EE3BC88
MNIGVTYTKLSNYTEALSNLQKGLAIAKSRNDGFGIFAAYNNIGLVYSNQGMNEEALQNYLSCLKTQISKKDSYKVGETYNNIASCYLVNNKPNLAIQYLKEGLRRSIAENDGAAIANNYIITGRFYSKKNDFPQMLEYYQKALKINEEIQNPFGIADAQYNIGYAYFKLGNTKKAIELINTALVTFKMAGQLDYIKDSYNDLTEIYKSTGNYKLAYENHVLYTEMHDSIVNVEKGKKFKELEVKFDLKNVKENAKIKEALAKKELQNQKNIRYYTIAGMLLVVIFLIILILQRNKIAKIRRQKALEEERNRISRDLHDNLGAQLSTAKMFMSSLKNKGIGENDLETLDTSIGMLDNSISDLRKIMNEMHNSVLREKGYLQATEELVNKINKLHLIQFSLSRHNIDVRPDHKIEHELFRITQELINNTLKYAQAKQVSIELLKRDGQLILMYEDDGIGFDVTALQRGNGLNNIETRVKAINGTVEFDSMPNAGFRP